MTKFILHGGCTRVESESNHEFFKEITRDLVDGAYILLSFHAAPHDLWAEKFEYIKKRITAAAGGKNFDYELARENPDEFTEQLIRADAIYLHGGDTLTLKAALDQIKNFAELLKGKTIIGSSAGVNVLPRYSFSTTRKIVAEGFGILPIKTFCHYTEDRVAELQKLKEYGEDMEIYLIPEERHVVINQ